MQVYSISLNIFLILSKCSTTNFNQALEHGKNVKLGENQKRYSIYVWIVRALEKVVAH